MKKLQEQGPLIEEIEDLLLSQFGVGASKEVQEAVIKFCMQQSKALKFLQTKQCKDVYFRGIIQEIESCPQCHRRQLKDFLESEMQCLTSYPLLLDNILKHTDGLTWVHQHNQSKEILQSVKNRLRQAENQHQLGTYQNWLDARSLQNSSHLLAVEFQNLDVKDHQLIHEGPLKLCISKLKTMEVEWPSMQTIMDLMGQISRNIKRLKAEGSIRLQHIYHLESRL
ncbi:rho guanine nucleotide exchange factor 11-like [Podarcis lilfordi]|uniref:Rho guanine nucleotide exchange factor 11-like n=1 Tax=Podarcis lilfordi TaxID=74358 RepID=A0AA35KR50_9SAUR|nr:rho guanine nucleotide exchange factor 11-like [Podarcis lilfordi]